MELVPRLDRSRLHVTSLAGLWLRTGYNLGLANALPEGLLQQTAKRVASTALAGEVLSVAATLQHCLALGPSGAL